MAKEIKSYGLIDEPPIYGNTLELWEQHLRELRRLPEDALGRAQMIATAEDMIAYKRRANLNS